MLKLQRILAAVLALTLSALVPRLADAMAKTVAVQGVLTTLVGGPVADGGYTLTFRIYDNETEKIAFWTEIHAAETVQAGGFFSILGQGTVPQAIDVAMFVAHPTAWISVQVNKEPELPRSALMPVPYAFVAEHAFVADKLSEPLGTDGIAAAAVTAAKVGFAYAGSNAKGGPALAALALDCVGCIKDDQVDFAYAASAKKGGPATSALLADSAKLADLATKASALACSGCVTLDMLAPDVATKYLPLAGGIIAGDLTVKGKTALAGAAVAADLTVGGKANLGITAVSGALGVTAPSDFGWKPVSAFLLANAAQPPVGCDAAHAGGLYFNSTDKALALCDGVAWRNFKYVQAGAAQSSPGASCKALLDSGDAIVDGTYWLDPDGGSTANAAQYYCDMKNGGWTRIALDTFENGNNGWNIATSACGSFGNILGGYNIIANGSTTKTYGLNAFDHTKVRVTVDYIRIDSWDGESGYVNVAGVQLFSKAGDAGNGAQVCGGNGGWLEEKWLVDVNADHKVDTVKVDVGSTLDQGASDESFGADNVGVWIK